MAHAWISNEVAGSGNDGRDTGPEWELRQLRGQTEDFGAATLVRGGTGNEITPANNDNWVVIGSDSVRVNGDPLLLGIRILSDRDEISIGGEPAWYFSTERLAKIEPFPGGSRVTYCARCKRPVAEATPAVSCPVCGIWFHQVGSNPSVEGESPCFSYGDECPSCRHPTELNAWYRWTPDDL